MRNLKFNTVLSSRLKLLLAQYSLSLSMAASFLKVGKSMIARFVRAENMPSSEVLSNLADFFCVSTDYLLGRTDDAQFDYYFTKSEKEFFDDPKISKWAKKQYNLDISNNPQFAPVYLRACRQLSDLPNEKNKEKNKPAN